MSENVRSAQSGVMKAAGILVIANFLSSILGYVRDIIMSSVFDMSSTTYAYNAAFTIPDLIYTILVGGGNVAMDAARLAKRLGADVTIVYRRSMEELPARKEEVEHAIEEGIIFKLLNNPIEIVGEEGRVKAVRCQEMELSEPDESGRRSPVPVEGKINEIEADCFIVSIGTSPNPLIKSTTDGLDANNRGCLVADENGATTREGVFAGGDAVTGAATVILAMGAGKKAAAAMDEYIQSKQ